MHYFVIIGDIVRSREIEQREAFQARLIETMAEANDRFSDRVVSAMMVNAGDSFQGIFTHDAPILLVCDHIRFSLAPYCRVRMGIGYGKVSTAIDPQASILADGPAFWSAREALDEVDERSYYRTRSVCLQTEEHALETAFEAANQVCLLADLVASGWKSRQMDIAARQVLSYGYDPVPQVLLAGDLGMKPQQLFASSKAMGLAAFLDAKRSAQGLLLKMTGEDCL